MKKAIKNRRREKKFPKMKIAATNPKETKNKLIQPKRRRKRKIKRRRKPLTSRNPSSPKYNKYPKNNSPQKLKLMKGLDVWEAGRILLSLNFPTTNSIAIPLTNFRSIIHLELKMKKLRLRMSLWVSISNI